MVHHDAQIKLFRSLLAPITRYCVSMVSSGAFFVCVLFTVDTELREKSELFPSSSWLQFAEVHTIPSHASREILLVAAIQYSIVARVLSPPSHCSIRSACSALNSNVKMWCGWCTVPFSSAFACSRASTFAFILPLWPSVCSMAIWLVFLAAPCTSFALHIRHFQFLGSLFSCQRIVANHFYEICTAISDDQLATQTACKCGRGNGID